MSKRHKKLRRARKKEKENQMAVQRAASRKKSTVLEGDGNGAASNVVEIANFERTGSFTKDTAPKFLAPKFLTSKQNEFKYVDPRVVFTPIADGVETKTLDFALPVRTRGGIPVYIIEVDPRVSGLPVKGMLGMNARFASSWTEGGNFIMPLKGEKIKTNRMDLFNISLADFLAGIQAHAAKLSGKDI